MFTLSSIRDSFKRRTVRMGVAEALAHAQVVINNHEHNTRRGIASMNSTVTATTRIGTFYFRAGIRAIGTGDSYLVTKSVELASINIHTPYQRLGACAAVLDGLEALAKESHRVVYVECVLNLDLDRFLRNRRLYRPLHGVGAGYESFWYDPRKPLMIEDAHG